MQGSYAIDQDGLDRDLARDHADDGTVVLVEESPDRVELERELGSASTDAPSSTPIAPAPHTVTATGSRG